MAPVPAQSWPRLRIGGRQALAPATIAVAMIVATAAVGTAALAGNRDLIFIEQGLTGPRNAQ